MAPQSTGRTRLARTALMGAARAGAAGVVRVLLQKGAPPNDHDSLGRTALLEAAEAGRFDVLGMLASSGADVNGRSAKDGNTALVWTAMAGRTDDVKLLLSKGADVNVSSINDHRTPLMWASWRGFTEIVRQLILKGANVNTPDWVGRTALMEGIRNNTAILLTFSSRVAPMSVLATIRAIPRCWKQPGASSATSCRCFWREERT